MANIKKNFNFRNGVQVDDDNLLVTDTGLVGIGTTIPNEALDVRGNIVVTGFTSSTNAKIGFLTVTTFEPSKIIGAGISIVSGIVTATGTGIITFFGDATNLQGMPTSQWADKDVGLGFTSIYNTGGNVGVGTEDPRSTFQVGNNADAGEKGVGISSVGNINMTGIVTASSFVGNVTGDVTGRITGDVVGNINSAGVSTAVTLDVNGDLDVDGHANIDNLSVAGVSTFTGLIDGNGGANIDNVQIGVTGDNEIDTSTGNLTIDSAGGTVTIDDQFAVTGLSTFTGAIDANGGATIDNVQIGVTGNNEIDTSTGNLTIDSAGGTITVDDNLGVTGTSTFSDDVGVVGLTTTKTLLVTGITTLTGNVNASGGITAAGAIIANSVESPNLAVTTKLGVGTTDTPTTDIQVKKSSGNAGIQVSAGSIASLNVGREVGTSKTHTSEIRFGGGAGAPYSASGTALDIINYDTGNFNYHLSGNSAGAVAGDFHWHKGINSARLMTLTGIGGSLGIGNTQPTKELDVTGAGNFSGDVTVGNNLTVGGALLGNVQGTLTGNVQGTLAGNTNTAVGISTLNNLSVSGVVTVTTAIESANIGIGTTVSTDPSVNQIVEVGQDSDSRVFIDATGAVGIRTTTTLANVVVNASEVNAVFKAVSIGATVLKSSVDFADAGTITTRFMLPPKITTTQRGNLSGVVAGAVIYNTSTNKLQVFNGSAWQDCN